MKVKINSVSKMVVHFVGNKAKGNGVDFGGNLIPVEDIECDIKKLVLKAFDFSDLYHFYFESTVELNPVYTFVRNIFQDSSTFLQQSKHIAKMLYENSVHPKIKEGELSLFYLNGCELDGENCDAVAIIKSETQQQLLQVSRNNQQVTARKATGISLSKVEKGCVILFKSLQPKERISVYGSNASPNSFDEKTALRSLQFLIETPTFLQLGVWGIVDNAQWYKVAHKLFEKYPYPVMFYSTTMNDTNTLRRIGQDYAYSKVLHKQLPSLVEKMFSLLADKNSPLGFWGGRNISTLLEELIKAVPSKYWDKYALQLWNDNKEHLFEEESRTDGLCELICSALLRSSDVLYSATVISDTLEKVRQNKKYELAQDLICHSRFKHNKTVAGIVGPHLVKFIEGICDVRDYILLGYLNRLLLKSQIKRICKTIPTVLHGVELRTSSINGLTFFATHDAAILAIVRKAIIADSSLWSNGKYDSGKWGLCDFLPVVNLDDELKWTKEEVMVIYEKLVSSAKQMFEEGNSMFLHIMNRQGLYAEMLQFIDLHRHELKGTDCAAIYQQIDDKYKELTSFKSVEESIYSEDEEAVLVALEVLAKRIKHDGIVEHLSTINILITRILCKNKNGYKSILDYLEYYVRFFAKDKEILAKIPQLIFLIDNLTMDVFKELEQNVLLCSELTILIAMHLQELGISSNGVTYWMEVKKSKFFNWSICNEK